ncbi:MAG TPA: hypothetical protein VKC35_16240 [Vicinamibacterales bacterium]|nr:hypothetical protein [Vicinamibacterales bacterium]
MKSVPDLLREADPLLHEPRRSPEERQMLRQRVLASPRGHEQQPRRRVVLAAVVVLACVGMTAAFWPRATVEVAAAVRFDVRLAEQIPGPGLREVRLPGSIGRIYLHPETVVSNGDIARAVVAPAAGSRFNISVTFTADGAAKMLTATQGHLGRPVAILLDGDLVMAPVVKSPVSGSAMITGNYTKAEADRIVAGIVGR